MDSHHLPLLPDFRIGHDLACPRNAQRSIFWLECDDYVAPGVSRVADDAVLKVERGDRQGFHGAQQRLEVLPKRSLALHRKWRESIESNRLLVNEGCPGVEILSVQRADNQLQWCVVHQRLRAYGLPSPLCPYL